MLKAIADNIKGLYSLLVGLYITGRYGLGPFPAWLKLVPPGAGYPQLTTHYPRRTIRDEDLVTFRGPVELTPAEDDPAKSRCVSCLMCVRACPSGCLTVVKGESGKAPVKWLSDFALCSLCGTCVEVCPAGALRFSHDLYWVEARREDLVRDLLARLAGNRKEKAAA
ncbi:MAG: 4Fe-4S binding protein [Candidatus Adiutrix sp.]|jgi:NADH-quinone oxidoreductase subunit I|nr:4Fe-4S binding protein [Candidatus Adiutrix sp.]